MHLLNSAKSELTIKICRFLSNVILVSNSHNEEHKKQVQLSVVVSAVPVN